MAGSVIVDGARTPMGRLLGSLKDFSGADLGGFAIKAALERSGVAPEQVQYVIMGQVLLAGAGCPASTRSRSPTNSSAPASSTSSWPAARSR